MNSRKRKKVNWRQSHNLQRTLEEFDFREEAGEPAPELRFGAVYFGRDRSFAEGKAHPWSITREPHRPEAASPSVEMHPMTTAKPKGGKRKKYSLKIGRLPKSIPPKSGKDGNPKDSRLLLFWPPLRVGVSQLPIRFRFKGSLSEIDIAKARKILGDVRHR
jgi:hypothetical protein